MPLEISEIGVKLAVHEPTDPAPGEGTAPATPPVTGSRIPAIVAAYVQKVLTALRLRTAR